MSQFYYIAKNFIELCIIDEVIELSARFDILEFQRATKFSLNQLSRTRIRTNKSYLLNESYTSLNLQCNTFFNLIFTFHVRDTIIQRYRVKRFIFISYLLMNK